MPINKLPDFLKEHYKENFKLINKRLEDFKQVQQSEYFYELVYCLCTPQSKASNAEIVVKLLKQGEFYQNPFDPTPILEEKSHYIRFHNTKAARIQSARKKFDNIIEILNQDTSLKNKRILVKSEISGFGMKESSHFLRNIGYRGLAILDRHILDMLVMCNVFEKVPKVATVEQYISVENSFKVFADDIKISIDVLDLLFWSYKTGDVLK